MYEFKLIEFIEAKLIGSTLKHTSKVLRTLFKVEVSHLVRGTGEYPTIPKFHLIFLSGLTRQLHTIHQISKKCNLFLSFLDKLLLLAPIHQKHHY